MVGETPTFCKRKVERAIRFPSAAARASSAAGMAADASRQRAGARRMMARLGPCERPRVTALPPMDAAPSRA